MSAAPSPMELLRQLAPEFAKNQMEAKSLLFEHPNYQAIPAKYKILIGIAAAAALGSEMCTEMWAHQAKEKGLTDREIVEAVLVARFMKQATVNDTAAKMFAGLTEAAPAS